MNIKVIKNFFELSDLKFINSLKLPKKVGNNDIAIYHNKINKSGKISSQLFDDSFLESIYKKYHSAALVQ